MEAEARYTWVGAMLLLLVVALVGALVWLKNVGTKRDFEYYTIHFEHQSLEGLQIGADVELRGIKVGRVEDYALAGEGKNAVRVDVRINRRAPVRKNTVAVVTRNILTGIATISLVNSDPPGPPLTDVPDGEQYPVIGEGRSNLEELAGKVNQVGELATAVLNNLNQLLRPENREALMATVRNLRTLTAGLNGRLQTLDGTLAQVGQAAGEVGAAATRVGTAGERLAQVAEKGGERLDTTLADAEHTLADARQALTQLSKAADGLQQQAAATARRLEETAAGADDRLESTAAELRLSIDAATRVLERLHEPRAALLGPGKRQLGPGGDEMTSRRRLLATLLPLGAAPLLPACVSVDIGQDAAPHAYLALHDDGHAERRDKPLVPALLLQALPADALADTSSIAYSRVPHQFAFYQLATWTERPVRLVPRLLQRRLEARGSAGAVGLLGDPLRADWLLTLSLDALYHDVSVEPGVGRLKLAAELFDRRTRGRVAQRGFEAEAAAGRADSAAAAEALSRAMTQVFDTLLPWLEQALQQAAAHNGEQK